MKWLRTVVYMNGRVCLEIKPLQKLIEEILDEEKAANDMLTKLARDSANEEAECDCDEKPGCIKSELQETGQLQLDSLTRQPPAPAKAVAGFLPRGPRRPLSAQTGIDRRG